MIPLGTPSGKNTKIEVDYFPDVMSEMTKTTFDDVLETVVWALVPISSVTSEFEAPVKPDPEMAS